MMSKTAVILLMAIATFALFPLVMGASFLEVKLPGGLPLGNALTAIGFCSTAGAAIGLSDPGTLHRYGSVTSLIAAIVWLPVSVALAGNLALNFSGAHGLVWIGLTLVTILAVLSSLSWAFVRWLRKCLPHADPSNAA